MELLTEAQFNRLCKYVDNVKELIEKGLPIGM
jgi:hypothetical protein